MVRPPASREASCWYVGQHARESIHRRPDGYFLSIRKLLPLVVITVA